MAGRVQKTLKNARVNLLFYFLSLFFAFFSRKIFLDSLGADFIGLTGTLGSILGYLNLAELGIGSAISVFLYKPLQQNNREDINEILSVFAYLYRRIGWTILLGGVAISLFFPLIFGNTDIGMGIIYFSFYSFLFSSLSGYFINYRQILLNADQKTYIVSIYFQSANLIKTAIQIFLAYNYENWFLWVSIELIFSVMACVILNWKIAQEYHWLRTNISSGKELLKKYPNIISNTKQIFIHKIKDFILTKSDEVLIFIFVSLKMVAYYGNYVMIINKVSLFFISLFDGVLAGVGNLVAEGEKKKMMNVFWELMLIRHFIAGFICVSLYFLINPFIILWLGEEYLLDNIILILLLINLYIAQSRGAVDMFNHAHGLYADTWSAWVELVLNLFITIVVGYYYGLIGLLLGKIISILIIVVFWKPYYLFSSGFHLPISQYWRGALKYYLINIVSFSVTYLFNEYVIKRTITNLFDFIIYALSLVGVYIIINILLMYLFANGTKLLVERIKKIRR